MFDAIEKALALRSTPLFAELPASELIPVANLCTEVDLEADEKLFAEGDLGDAIYVVVRGRVTVERGGKKLASLGVGELVGEMAAIDWLPRSAAVMASEPSVLIRLDRHDMLDLLIDHPVLAEKMAAVLAARIRKTDLAAIHKAGGRAGKTRKRPTREAKQVPGGRVE